MSISDAIKLREIEATVATLLARVKALEARQVAETPSSAAAAAAMAGVVEALKAGQSIRGAATKLGLDRSKVARLRQRAIAEGCLNVSPD